MNFLTLVVFIIFGSIAGLETAEVEKSCFKFTWPGSIKIDPIDNEINCTKLKKFKIPCVEPIIYSLTPPNLNELWSEKNRASENPICSLQKGYSCIKYTYSFDNAITNATYFCGKMIENKETAIKNNCYTQKMGGYDVEACACQPNGFRNDPNEMPCNLSTKLNYSSSILVLALLVSTLKISFKL